MISFDSLRPDLVQALRDAGWYSQRRVNAAPWLESLRQEGYVPNSKAEEILASLGGLVIEQIAKCGPNFSNDEPFNFDPISAGAGQRGLALEIEAALGGHFFRSVNGSVIQVSSWRPVGGWLPLVSGGFGVWVPRSKMLWSWRFSQIGHWCVCTLTRG
ncbi:SUKH-3 domain-containing protein [Streptomyces hebeiensis]